jgi:hypothetical protein
VLASHLISIYAVVGVSAVAKVAVVEAVFAVGLVIFLTDKV